MVGLYIIDCRAHLEKLVALVLRVTKESAPFTFHQPQLKEIKEREEIPDPLVQKDLRVVPVARDQVEYRGILDSKETRYA